MPHLLAPALLGLALLPHSAAQAPEETQPVSALVNPLYLDPEPPELRTLGLLWFPHVGATGVPNRAGRSFDEALAVAAEVVAELRAGGSWMELAARHSAFKNRASGSVLGTYARGMLSELYGDFLFSAEVGDVSDPLVLETGIYVAARLATHAGCRVLVVRGSDDEARARAEELVGRARSGEDFRALVREHSDHPGSRERGGDWGRFERGPNDSLLKLEVFQTEVGAVSGPHELGGSLYLLQRVPPEEIPDELADDYWIRLRAIALAFAGAEPGLLPNARTAVEAAEMMLLLRERIVAGEDMAELARRHCDDPTGDVRGGDLGWVHRRQPGLPRAFLEMFGASVGEVGEPRKLDQGVVLLRRER